jgi:hypothetical protein
MKKVTRANEMEKDRSRIASRKWDPSVYEVETQLRLLSELWEGEKDKGSLEGLLPGPEHLWMKKELETKLPMTW